MTQPTASIVSGQTGKLTWAADVAKALWKGGPTSTFTTWSTTAPSIPSDVTLVATTGYSTAGVGPAFYKYDAAVDAAHVSSNPRSSFLAADGRGFKLTWGPQNRVNPFQFGALADGTTDDNVALQAFFDFVSATDVDTADVGGAFRSSVALVFGRSTTPLTLHFRGRFSLTMTGSGDYAFTFKNWTQGTWDHFRIVGPGSTNDFSSKTWHTGVLFDNTQRVTFRFIFCRFFAFAGIAAGSNNNTLNDYGMVKALDCGSGARNGATIYGLTTEWSSPVNAGSSASTAQSTTLDVSVLPPDYITSGEFGNLGDAQYLIRITELDGTKRLHWIKSVDEGAGTIEVFPWVHSTAPAGTADYVWGGALYLRGNDSNVVSFSAIDATRCGIALAATSLYPPTGKRVVTQFCGVGVAIGRYPGGAALGGRIDGMYFEGNEEDVVLVSRPGASVYNSIGNTYALQLDKCHSIGAPRLSDDSFSPRFAGFDRLTVDVAGRPLYYEKASDGTPGGAANTYVLNRPDMHVPIYANDRTIVVSALDLDVHRLFGYDTIRFTVVGTGTGGAPTGTITFQKVTDWTLNGGAVDVSYSGFAQPAEFVLRFDVESMDVEITPIYVMRVGSSTTMTQTYSTASTTHAAMTAADLTDNSGGSSGGTTIAVVTDNASAANAIATLAAMVDKLTVDMTNHKNFTNGVVDALQSRGVLG